MVYGNSRTLDDDTITSEATYIYRWSTLHKVSGDKQIGALGTQLADPFVVEVRDASGATVSGQVITFDAPSGGSRAEDPNFPEDLYGDEFSTDGIVKTDSSGRANAFLVLADTGNTPLEHTVPVTFPGTKSVEFSATGQDSSLAASIEIESGDGQSAASDQTLTDPLVVIVTDLGGRIVKGTSVKFTTDSGALSGPST